MNVKRERIYGAFNRENKAAVVHSRQPLLLCGESYTIYKRDIV